MNGIIATFKIKSDQTKAFEARFLRLTDEVKTNEPGARMYQLCKSKTEAGVYKVMEIYADEATVQAHKATPYFKAAFEDFEPMMSEPLELYDVVTVD